MPATPLYHRSPATTPTGYRTPAVARSGYTTPVRSGYTTPSGYNTPSAARSRTPSYQASNLLAQFSNLWWISNSPSNGRAKRQRKGGKWHFLCQRQFIIKLLDMSAWRVEMHQPTRKYSCQSKISWQTGSILPSMVNAKLTLWLSLNQVNLINPM